MVERVAKSRKMAELHTHARDTRARAAPGMRCGTGIRGDTTREGRVATQWGGTHGDTTGRGEAHPGGRCGQDSGWAGGRASRGGWVGRSAHRLVRPLGPGDGPMDPSP
jgi:hypothetical protein